MSSEPTATFLIPVWNGRDFLRDAIDSVLAQTRNDWLLVVVDDASIDDSAKIVASYDDPRIELIRLERNVGQTRALNTGLGMVQTPWVARLDQDDVAAPTRFEAQLAYLEENPGTVLVGSWADFIDDQGSIVGHYRFATEPEDVLRELYLGPSPFIHSAVTFSTEAARALGGYPTEIVYAQDIALWAKLAAHGRIANVPQALTYLRRHPAQTSRSPKGAAGLLRDALTVTADLPDSLASDRKTLATWRARRLRLMIELSFMAARDQDWQLARRSVWDSLRSFIADPLAVFRIVARVPGWALRRIREGSLP